MKKILSALNPFAASGSPLVDTMYVAALAFAGTVAYLLITRW